MRDTEKALLWITGLLEEKKIPYRIVGGFAARMYGSDRELADIDFEIPKKDFECIVPEIAPYIISGPGFYEDSNWKLFQVTLVYEGQEIDIAATGAQIFNQQTKEWEEYKADLKNVEWRDMYGKKIPLEPLESVVSYKMKLARDVDLEDVKNLQNIK